MTDSAGKFILKNSAELYPEAGLDPDQGHFVVLLGDIEVGVIYQIDAEWMWLMTLEGIPDRSGRADSRRGAREAFREAWDAEAAKSGSAGMVTARRSFE